jgi:hypothetical protein
MKLTTRRLYTVIEFSVLPLTTMSVARLYSAIAWQVDLELFGSMSQLILNTVPEFEWSDRENPLQSE